MVRDFAMADRDRLFFIRLAFLGTALAAVFGLVDYVLWPREPLERISFPGSSGQLEGKVWSPQSAPRLGVLFCHGVETNKEVMDPMALEFVRRGAIALTFDYGGYGESTRHPNELQLMVEDTRAAYRELQKRAPGLPVVVIGHSMGATFGVVFAGQEPSVRAAIALGNEPVSDEVPPRNVLYAMGVYDVFHSVEEMLQTTRESARNPALEPNVTHGRFEDGTARAMATSPWVDHGPEPLDPLLTRRSLEWVKRAVPEAQLEERGWFKEISRQAVHFGLVVALAVALLGLFVYLDSKNLGWSARSHVAAFFVVGLAGWAFPIGAAPLWADLSLVALGSGMVAMAVSKMEAPSEKLRQWAMMVLLFSGCLLMGVIAVGLPGLLRLNQLAEVWKAPLGIAVLRPCEGLGMLRGYAFHRYSDSIVPGIGLTAILLLEILKPGALVAFAMRIMTAVVQRLANFQFSFSVKGSRQSSIIAMVLMSILVVVVFRRVSEGWINSETVSRLVGVGLRGLLLPLILFCVGCKVFARRLLHE
jgi:pimeloyl-ACP methyl ester carboxylesterase